MRNSKLTYLVFGIFVGITGTGLLSESFFSLRNFSSRKKYTKGLQFKTNWTHLQNCNAFFNSQVVVILGGNFDKIF